MKKSRVILALMLCPAIFGTASAAPPSGFDQVNAKALAGDYQAQRNLAYGYSSAPYAEQQKNELLGCAWRIVIVHSGSTRVDQTDIENHRMHCGRLDPTQQAAAQAQARKLYKQVYRTEAKF